MLSERHDASPPPPWAWSPGAPALLLCLLVLGASVAAFFAPFFLTGQPPFGGDLVMLNYPLLTMLHQTLAAGAVPLWNPFSGGGSPLAPFSALVAYPPSWLLAALPASAAIGWTYCFDFLLAGTSMILLTRRLGAGPVGSLVGALCFTFSGFIIAHMSAGHFLEIGVIAWLPALFYTTQRALVTGRHGAVLLAGTCLGLHILANGIELLPFTLYPLALALIWHAAGVLRRHDGAPRQALARLSRGLLLCGEATSVAAGLCAVLALPFLQVLGHTPRHAGVPFGEGAHLSLPLEGMGMLTLPTLFGQAPDDTYWLGVRDHLYFHELYAFVGIIPLAVAVLSWVHVRRSPTIRLYTVLALGALTLALGRNTPLYGPIYALLPGLSLTRVPARWLLVVTFAIAVLAALGVDVLLDLARRRKQRLLGRWLLAFTAGVVLVCLGPLALLGAAGALPRGAPTVPGATWLTVGPAVLRLTLSLAVLWALAVAAAWDRLGPRSLGVLLVGLTIGDLASANWTLIRFVDPVPFFTRSEAAAFLQAHPGTYRVFAPDHSLPLRSGMIDGRTQDIQDFAPVTLEDYWIYTHPEQARRRNQESVTQARAIIPGYNGTVTRLLGVRYVLSDRPLSGPTLRPVTRFSATHWWVPHLNSWNAQPWRTDTYVYRDAAALPAAFFAPHWRQVGSEDAARDLSRRGDIDLRAVALLSPRRPEPPWIDLPVVRAVQAGWADWLSHHDRTVSTTQEGGWRLAMGQNVVTLTGRAPTTGYVILDDVFYPGWVATVDGQPARIARVDSLLRAVRLTPGEHRVQLVYAPLSFLCGSVVTVLTMAALVAAMAGSLFSRLRRHRGRPPPTSGLSSVGDTA